MATPAFPHDPADRVQQMIQSMLGTMVLARELVLAQRPIDVAGLDQQAGLLCARLLDLPFAEGRALRPGLFSLAHAAEELEVALSGRRPSA